MEPRTPAKRVKLQDAVDALSRVLAMAGVGLGGRDVWMLAMAGVGLGGRDVWMLAMAGVGLGGRDVWMFLQEEISRPRKGYSPVTQIL